LLKRIDLIWLRRLKLARLNNGHLIGIGHDENYYYKSNLLFIDYFINMNNEAKKEFIDDIQKVGSAAGLQSIRTWYPNALKAVSASRPTQCAKSASIPAIESSC